MKWSLFPGTLLVLIAGSTCSQAAPAPPEPHPVIAGERAPLPRRVFFGAALESVSEGERGIRIRTVFPGASAAAAGLQADDLLIELSDMPLESVAQWLEHTRNLRSGDEIEVAYLRDGVADRVGVTLLEMPREHYDDIDVVYGEIEVAGTRRRSIMTRPSELEGPAPAVLLIGGVGCYSVDVPIGQTLEYVVILNELTRRGYVTLRIDKSGIGDSEGIPCQQQDFQHELRDYIAAARALFREPSVDRARIFVFGHSMGGLHAPFLAAAVADDAPLAGVMVMGTVATNWFAYELENGRRQLPMYGTPADEVERSLQRLGLCLAALTVELRSPEEITAAHPECESEMPFPAHYTFRQQIVGLDLTSAWAGVEAPVLAVYGASDFLTSAAEHYYLAASVNRVRPGSATVKVVEGLDHYFQNASTQAASLSLSQAGQRNNFDTRIVDLLDEWMADTT